MRNQFEYFLKNFELFHNTNEAEIEYGNIGSASVVIRKNCDDSFWLERKDINTDEVVWKEWKGVRIPFLFDRCDDIDIITEQDGKATINYDIVASAVYFLSGWNEYVNPTKDRFGRITFRDSIISRLEISAIPVVNYYFNILEEALFLVYGDTRRKDYWDDRNFAVLLTHDIDTCNSGWLEGSVSELKKRQFTSIPKLIFKRMFTGDDWFNFKVITEIEGKYNASSSFYFLPQKGKAGGLKNADYDIKSKSIQEAILFLRRHGKEIGVHGSFGSHINQQIFRNDISRLGSQPITGNRFHYLMFDPEKTVSVLEECDIKYDTSLGFAEQVGFRRATCFPFYLYNFEKNEVSPVIEIPLIMMDTTLASAKYMNINKEEALMRFQGLIDETERFRGVFTLLWHNTYFSDYKYSGWKEVYIEMLDYSHKRRGLLTDGKSIYERITG